MPYTRFVKRGNAVKVYKRTPSGGEALAFTSHDPSLEEAHRKAAIRESHAEGSMRSRRRVPSKSESGGRR